jgi:beta-mannosidase
MTAFLPLNSGWTLSIVEPGDGAPGDLPAGVAATVPGCVHTDLLAEGLIPDPYLDGNEDLLQWIGRSTWAYETGFEWVPGGADRVDLVCAGLDTVARVVVNGVQVGATANQHRSYRFDVGGLLREGTNTVRVEFGSVYAYAESVRAVVGDRPAAYAEPYQYVRKMACNFGWDWGPRLVTAGIWQPIGLETWSAARLAGVRPEVRVDEAGSGQVRVGVDVERAGAAVPLRVVASVAGQRAEVELAAGESSGVVALVVPAPRLWSPRGLGEPHRYRLEVTVSGPDGAVVDAWSRMVGFRTVEIDTAPDGAGRPFTVVVNGVPVFVRGVNWIPDDVFVTRVDRARLAARLEQAVAAGVNLLRIWGGGRYESFDFYDLCDELGLMVEQDFLFACAAYPEEEPLASEVAAEAAEQVERLMPHPSLMWWCGNNENQWGWHDWGWQDRLDGRSWGEGFYVEVLPRIVAEVDPTRPYWPGSPYSGVPEIHPNNPAHGTMHIWDVWNTDDYTRYRSYRPRFVAEFGFQAPPAFATLRRAISDEPLTPDSPGMLGHQKAIDGNGKLARGLAAHFPAPESFDDWHWATQLNQARAISYGVEHFRSLRPYCMGTIVWQLNDCWPVTSWAAVDGDGRRKPMWYALRRSYAERLITIQPRDGGLAVVAVNDSATRWRTQFDVTRRSFTGTPLAKVTMSLEIAAGGTSTVPLPSDVATPEHPDRELLTADPDTGRTTWFFSADHQLAYPEPAYQPTVTPVSGGYTVAVTAHSLIRDLSLFPDRLDPAASVDDQLITLLPGETATFTVRTDHPLDTAALTRTPVLRSANELVSGRGTERLAHQTGNEG